MCSGNSLECVALHPSAEELSRSLRVEPLRCTQAECTAVFRSLSNLHFHLEKSHGVPRTPKHTNTKFYCPEIQCSYNKINYFKSLKLVKQHYWKVHLEKRYPCNSCNKKFSIERIRNAHVQYCGVIFKCSDCTCQYFNYENLQTHARRKTHTIASKMSFKHSAGNNLSKTVTHGPSKNRLILPKSAIFVTEPLSQLNQTPCVGVCTIDLKKTCTNAETQTTTSRTKYDTRSTCTQDLWSSGKADIVKPVNEDTQFLHDGTLTETFDTNFFNCNMETQTDLILSSNREDPMLFCDEYSNMCTQTNDINIFPEISNTLDNCTQTGYDHFLKSVESQTMDILFCDNKFDLLAHMETQTDLSLEVL